MALNSLEAVREAFFSDTDIISDRVKWPALHISGFSSIEKTTKAEHKAQWLYGAAKALIDTKRNSPASDNTPGASYSIFGNLPEHEQLQVIGDVADYMLAVYGHKHYALPDSDKNPLDLISRARFAYDLVGKIIRQVPEIQAAEKRLAGIQERCNPINFADLAGLNEDGSEVSKFNRFRKMPLSTLVESYVEGSDVTAQKKYEFDIQNESEPVIGPLSNLIILHGPPNNNGILKTPDKENRYFTDYIERLPTYFDTEDAALGHTPFGHRESMSPEKVKLLERFYSTNPKDDKQ